MTKPRATEMDRHIGARLRKRRQELQITMTVLAAALGVSYQQVQKYEAGRSRMSAERLYRAAKTLNVSMEYFFR